MAKKKQRISATELFIWRLIGILLVVTWVIVIAFMLLLANQYGWYNAGFIYFYPFLILVPLSYSVLYASIARLEPKGSTYGVGIFILLLGILPLAFFLSFFIRIGLDPTLTLVLVSGLAAFAVYLLHRKSKL